MFVKVSALSYNIQYRCTNCFYTFDLFFEKFKFAPQKTVCKKCGCNTAHKTWGNTNYKAKLC